MNLSRLSVACLLLAALCVTTAQTQEKKVELIPVTYNGLKQEVLKHRGKVLVVDIWASFCSPCREKLPHFIEMQQKYAEKGLVVITVSVDLPERKEGVDAANAFLRKVNSPLVNLLLNESPETWTKKLTFPSLPCYFIFDRQGKWVRFSGDGDKSVNYDELERTVVQMLNEK